MNCIVVDDDLLVCKILAGFAHKCSALNLVNTFSDSIAARNFLTQRQDIDLVILDIMMPVMDGFDFIRSLDSLPNIIIVSSAEEYVRKAHDLNVVDYLLKPVSYERFVKAIGKTKRRVAPKEVINDRDKEIFIKQGSSLVKIKLRDIIFIEALENCVALNTSNERFTVHFTMKGIENQLPSDVFTRVHSFFIVNRSMIRNIKEDTLDLLSGDSVKRIPVEKSFMDSLQDNINNPGRAH
jgi:DNA-binding LytR/AlgR family response regulator